MATSFSDIYDLFLAQIDDYELGELNPDEIDIVLEKFLINGLINIQTTISSIEDIDTEVKQFNQDIPLMERILIAKSMKLEWVREKKYSEELMRKSIGDRDYKAVQGTDYLKSLTAVESKLEQELKKSIVDRSYRSEDYYGDMLT
ncbi:hypothetical protein [Enterococcus sp. N249-2]